MGTSISPLPSAPFSKPNETLRNFNSWELKMLASIVCARSLTSKMKLPDAFEYLRSPPRLYAILLLIFRPIPCDSNPSSWFRVLAVFEKLFKLGPCAWKRVLSCVSVKPPPSSIT
jgi:hypothetical protein